MLIIELRNILRSFNGVKIKQTIIVALVAVSLLFIFPTNVNAAECVIDGKVVETNLIDCENESNTGDPIKGSPIWGLLLMAINILTAGIGIAAVGGIIYGSIMYSSAGGNSENIKKAKTIIINVVIGIVMYLFMYSFLNYLIPGGVFN
jgi:hypothetical protein